MEQESPSMHPKKRHPVLRVIGGVIVLVIVAWCTFAVRFLWVPKVDPLPAHVDAIIQLGGPNGDGDTYERTRNLTPDHASNLVVSDPYVDDPEKGEWLCRPREGVNVICFHPDPSTTQGEARAIAQLAQENGWNDIMVYSTGKHHVERARLLIGRCYSGTLHVSYEKTPLTLKRRLWEWGYQTAGMAKASLIRGC